MSMRRDPAWRRYARFLRADPARDVDDELAFHLERRVQDYIARGMDPEAARAAALERFGDVSGVRQVCTALLAEDQRAAARRDWLGDLAQDLRFAARAARRAPLFTSLAVLTLALGIGANAAVFGVVKSVLLDALPYADADRIARIYGVYQAGTRTGPLSAGVVRDLREQARSFERLAAFQSLPRESVLDAGGTPRVVEVVWTEPELFRTLGVAAGRGRMLRAEDAESDTAYNVVVTHAAWQRHFGGDPAVIGGTVRINGITRNVVGVTPRDFVGPVGDVDFYFPMHLRHLLARPADAYSRQNHGLVARLQRGATHEGAQREVAALGARIAREQPQFNTGVELRSMPVRDALVGDTRTPLLVLMASAALVLVITCANLAGALLSRTLSRRKEFAVRAALGAGRGRLVRQLLSESVLLSAAGGAAGVLLAVVGLRVLRDLASTALPPYADLSLDRGALAVTALLAVATGIAFGLAPALAVNRADVQGTLRDEGRGTSETRRSRHLRGGLVAGQIALCVSLLAGAGLLARSLWAMTNTPLGFDAGNLLAATVQLPPGRYSSGEARARFVEEFEERLRAIPGVTSVATSGDLPTRVLGRNGITIEGTSLAPGAARPMALYYTVSDDFFRTMRIPLVGGRTFGPQDRFGEPYSVIVSEGTARRFWPGENAVGKRLRMGPDPSDPWMTVVGVVGDVANDPALLQPDLATYHSLRQAPWNGPIFLIRTQGDPAALAKPVEHALAEHDPSLPLKEAVLVRSLITEGLAGRRLPVMLMTAFGALALLLASVGVYAMFASMAAAREREFGVRLALGASRRAIAGLVLRQGAVWMGIGLVAGAAGVVLVSRLVGGLLYGVSPFDPLTLASAVAILVVCATAAVLVPVRRATKADPIAVLR
jgi:predicted permease